MANKLVCFDELFGNTFIVPTMVVRMPQPFNIGETIERPLVVVRCGYCGTKAKPYTRCESCGAPWR